MKASPFVQGVVGVRDEWCMACKDKIVATEGSCCRPLLAGFTLIKMSWRRGTVKSWLGYGEMIDTLVQHRDIL